MTVKELKDILAEYGDEYDNDLKTCMKELSNILGIEYNPDLV